MVGHRTANRLSEVRVTDFSLTRTVQLPTGEWADDIAAVPGEATSFAVVLVNQCCSPSLEGTILVRNGVIAPGRGPDHTGPTAIAFAGDPTKLYGYNGGTTDYGFYTLSVDANGLTVASLQRRVLEGFNLKIVSSGGRLHASNGRVVVPTTGLPLGAATAAQGVPVPVPGRDRLLFVGSTTVTEHDVDGFWSVATRSHGAPGVRDATLAGTRVAIAATDGTIRLLPLT
jgi:hypothetical protein